MDVQQSASTSTKAKVVNVLRGDPQVQTGPRIPPVYYWTKRKINLDCSESEFHPLFGELQIVTPEQIPNDSELIILLMAMMVEIYKDQIIKKFRKRLIMLFSIQGLPGLSRGPHGAHLKSVYYSMMLHD